MLVATAVGTVDMVLLMGGKSSWNLINTVVGLSANIILNLILIPRYGGTGAAIAWSSSILFTNLAPLVQVWKFLGMHPFGRGFPKVVLAAGAAYGALGLVLRVGARHVATGLRPLRGGGGVAVRGHALAAPGGAPAARAAERAQAQEPPPEDPGV